MRTLTLRAVLTAALGIALLAGPVRAIDYPGTPRGPVVDDYFGTKVADPYRWLESDVRTSDSVATWVEQENKVTFAYLESIPERAAIQKRLTDLWNYERFSPPSRKGKFYFYSRNDGLQNQWVLYRSEGLTGDPQVVLDPNILSADGTVALSGTSVTDDASLMAYGLSASGSDWQEWHVRDLSTGQDRPDVIKWVKWSGASWKKDDSGFFYSRYAEPKEGSAFTARNEYHKLCYHKLGTPQSEDVLVYDRPKDPEETVGGGVTDDGHYLVISVSKTGPKNLVYYVDLTKAGSPPVALVDTYEANYSLIDNVGSTFYFTTDKDAPKSKIVSVDVAASGPPVWRTVVPEAAEVLDGANCVNNELIGMYLKDAATKVRIFDLKGTPVRDVELPGIGTANGFGGRREDTETFYNFSSFATPPTIFRYDMASGRSTAFRQAKVAFNPADFEVKQVFYPSKDGTKIPMFLAYRKGLVLDGNNPTLLYGYGGFSVSLTPTFSPSRVGWMEMGGVYAVPNLRGGGEYGEEWHLAGTKLRKQNVFDDFIAAAEWLIQNKYTQPKKLAVFGGSNGGLLVGAVETQRPDLFGACLPAVGVMDMLRYHKFTIGKAWAYDYGTSDDPQEFKALFAYSPYHNLKPAQYPPTLVTTADHDDRVVPGHSFKFAAALQHAQQGPAPVLIRIETKAGHGGGKPTAKQIEETADEWAFLVRSLGMKVAGS